LRAATCGVRTLAHADGGGVLFADSAADVEMFRELLRASLDRLGVCNRLNLLLIHSDRWDELVDVAREELSILGIAPVLPPHAHPRGHEWALDEGHEAHVTIDRADTPADAAAIANTENLRPRRGHRDRDPSMRASSLRPMSARAPSGMRRRGCWTGSSCWAHPRRASTSTTSRGRAAPSRSKTCTYASTWCYPPMVRRGSPARKPVHARGAAVGRACR